MRAISLWQPWASAMALGFKRIETRHWRTNYTGLLAIHAAKRWTRAEQEFTTMLRTNGIGIPFTLPLGAVVATVRLVECRPTERIVPKLKAKGPAGLVEFNLGNYDAGRWGWIFVDIKPLAAPIPFKGAQGFFDVPDELLREVAA